MLCLGYSSQPNIKFCFPQHILLYFIRIHRPATCAGSCAECSIIRNRKRTWSASNRSGQEGGSRGDGERGGGSGRPIPGPGRLTNPLAGAGSNRRSGGTAAAATARPHRRPPIHGRETRRRRRQEQALPGRLAAWRRIQRIILSWSLRRSWTRIRIRIWGEGRLGLEGPLFLLKVLRRPQKKFQNN